jgi:hypothetical protein
VIELHVAPDGSDGNPGTAEGPFASLPRARDAARQIGASAPDEDVTVFLRGGRHELAETLELGPADSGSEKRSVTWTAFPGEIPVVSGGRRIEGWREGEGGLWTARAPWATPAEGGRRFRQLFVNGRRATLARFPRRDEAGGGFLPIADERLADDLAEHTLSVEPGALPALADPTEVEAVMLGHWEIKRKRVASVDRGTGLVTLAPPHAKGLFWKCHCGFFEGAREFLTGPGEWHLDAGTGTVTYVPLPGEDMTKAEVVAPRLECLLRVRGEEGRPVRNLHFRGIRFEHADWPLPEQGYIGLQAGYHFPPTPPELACAEKVWLEYIECLPVGSAVEWEFVEDSELDSCEVARVGGGAVHLRRGSSRNVIRGCRFRDVGANAVWIGEYWRHTYDHGRQAEIRDSWVPRGNRVERCLIEEAGSEYYGAVGIGLAFTEGAVVSRNEMRRLPYTGISVGFHWNEQETACRGNVIERNHIHDVMRLMADGGGIYTLGFQPGSVIRENAIHGIGRSPHARGAANNGLFMDECSRGFLVEGNVVWDTAGDPTRFNRSRREDQTWGDNRLGEEPRSGDPTVAEDGIAGP